MNNGLFSRLAKGVSSASASEVADEKKRKNFPRENFFSELFAYLLESHQDLILIPFLKEIGFRGKIENPIVKSQDTLPKKEIADITIKPNEKNLIIIESKIDAKFDKGQIETYLEEKEELGNYGLVVSITQKALEDKELEPFRKDKRFKHRLWSEVAELLKNLEKKGMSETNKFLLSETIKYMEDENMTEFEGFEDTELLIGNSYGLFEEKAGQYLGGLRERIQEKYKLYTKINGLGFSLGRGEKRPWLGFWGAALNNEGKFKLYACVWFINKKKDALKKGGIFEPTPSGFKECGYEWDGEMYFMSVGEIIGNSEGKEQSKKLDGFFYEGLGELKRLKII